MKCIARMTGFRYARVYSSFYLWTEVPCSGCRRIYSLEQCQRRKSHFRSLRGNTIDQEEEKTENEFTPEEESREENDPHLQNSKPSNF